MFIIICIYENYMYICKVINNEKHRIMKTQYRVHAEGYGIKTEDLYFNSKKEAISYMKKWFDFYTRMEASLFTCIKEIEDDSTWVETKYCICNI